MLASPVRVTRFLGSLRGGAQSRLVQASDGHHYVVKFNNNLQGPNLAFNEAMGTELYRARQLSVPMWEPLLVTPAFVHNNPDCWISTETGKLRPASGICFGSRFVGETEARVLEILPGTYFARVLDRMDFWRAWVLDVCAHHADVRQAIFIERSGEFEPVFIDHGHLFGGADGKKQPKAVASRYLDPRIYPPLLKRDVRGLKMMRPIDVDRLWHMADNLPDEWKSTSALNNFAHCLNNLSSPQHLASVVDLIVETFEQDHSRMRNRNLYEPISIPRIPLMGTYPAT